MTKPILASLLLFLASASPRALTADPQPTTTSPAALTTTQSTSLPILSRPAQTLARLRALPRLPIPHVAFSISVRAVIAQDPILTELVRISRIMPIKLKNIRAPGYREASIEMARRAGADFAIVDSPYYRDRSRRRELMDLSAESNPAAAAELAAIDADLAALSGKLPRPPLVVALDTEIWQIVNKSQEHLRNLASRYDAVYSRFKRAFPDTPIGWFGYGPKKTRGYGWLPSARFNGREKNDLLWSGCYTPCDPFSALENLHAAAGMGGGANGDKPLMPWIAIGFEHLVADKPAENPAANKSSSDFSGSYPLGCSWRLGAIYNRPADLDIRYAPAAARIKFVGLYPGFLDPRTPRWLDHFVAYVNGAHNIKRNWTLAPNRSSPPRAQSSAPSTPRHHPHEPIKQIP